MVVVQKIAELVPKPGQLNSQEKQMQSLRKGKQQQFPYIQEGQSLRLGA